MQGRRRKWPSQQLASVLLLTALIALACDDDGVTSPPEATDIRGNYTVVHRFTATSGGLSVTADCPGSMTITTLTNGQFTGQLSIQDCPDLELESETFPVAGTVTSTGVVAFETEGVEELVDELTEEGCELLSADEALAGTFSGNTLNAEFSISFRCDGDEVQFTYRLMATRTG